MGEWREYKISDIADVIGGGTPKTSIDEYWNGDIPWLAPRDLTGYDKVYLSHGDRFITEEGLKKSSTKLMPKGSVLLTSRAPIGYVAIAQNEICTNQGFKSLVPKKDLCNSEFLYYWIKSNVDYLQQLGTGTTFAEISGSVVKNIDISLPPLKEQKAIAEVLSSLDDKIDLLHRQNKTLEEMAQTLFRQWFIEEVKDEWEVGVLDDILTVKGGTTPSTKNDEYWNGNICWSTPKDLSSNSDMYLFDTARKITESGLVKIGSGLLPKGTILLSSRAPVGYLTITEVPLAINQGYIAILDDKGFSKYFIFLWLRLNMEYIISNANGSTFLEISKTVFKSLEITKPSKELRKKFDEIVIDNFEKIKANTKQIKTLENMRDTLLPKLMSGEVRVKV